MLSFIGKSLWVVILKGFDVEFGHPLIIIVGLRRSGTTAFWEAFRKDDSLCCYDEPFNPNLAELPKENSKGTRAEFIDLFENDAGLFNNFFSPISLLEESSADITRFQSDYLAWLLNQNQGRSAVVVDSVRIGFKLEKIYEIIPQAILVHLYRDPVAWISSHLLPSGRGTWRKKIANIYRHLYFWTRKGFYNNWGYQEIVEREISNTSYWGSIDIRAEDLRNKPAFLQLALFWHWAFRETERFGNEFWGDRFFSIPFESFCLNPEKVISDIYTVAELKWKNLDYSYVRAANQGFKPDSRRWQYVNDILLEEKLSIYIENRIKV